MRKELFFSIKQTIPVFLGYIFLGIAFGLLLHTAGYGLIWALLSSVFIYAGSMQFVMITLLTSGANLIYTAVMTLFINGRHLFYGISFIDRFRNMGILKPYMIFSLTDETYSLLLSVNISEEMNEKRVYFLIAFLDQVYWVVGSVLGNVMGELITFDTTGIDFSMTALFVVIVLNQWLENKNHMPAIIGLFVSIICLLLLGPEQFLLPSLGIIAAILVGGRKIWTTES